MLKVSSLCFDLYLCVILVKLISFYPLLRNLPLRSHPVFFAVFRIPLINDFSESKKSIPGKVSEVSSL